MSREDGRIIAPVEIPRPPKPQRPERLFLFVCNDERPEDAYQWGQAGLQAAGMQQFGGGLDKGMPPERVVWRRAVPEDLRAFGFQATPLDEPPGDVGSLLRTLAQYMDRLPAATVNTALAFLQERYGRPYTNADHG